MEKKKLYSVRAKLFSDAADLVSKGWTQKKYKSAVGLLPICYCASGAIKELLHNESSAYTFEILGYPPDGSSIQNNKYILKDVVEWNDHPNQTQENVVKILRKVSKKYKLKAIKEDLNC